jgi:two-component system, cell cycle response regulator
MPARIVVIEDNPASMELICYLLRAFGHDPQTATDGAKGFDLAQREQPDLVLCDIELPVMDGYEVVRRLKSHPMLRMVPVVALTAFAMVGDRDKIVAAGFDGYLPKPIDPETFVGQVEAFLESGQQRSCPSHPDAPAGPAVAATVVPIPEHSTPQPAWRATILAVDDYPVNLAFIRSTFEPLGFKVITASGAGEGRALAQQTAPDLILSDLYMPRENGYEFLRSSKADPQLRSIPFVLISSSVLPRDREQDLPAGAVALIPRPIDPLVLVAKVEACLRERKEARIGQDPDR